MNKASNDGKTPLFNAAANGHDDIARMLIKSGANVDLVNNDGEPPLNVATYYGNFISDYI